MVKGTERGNCLVTVTQATDGTTQRVRIFGWENSVNREYLVFQRARKGPFELFSNNTCI
jgi:hypothetical protein